MQKFKSKIRSNKGVSLPMAIGLVSLLMIASVAVNELIIRALRSANQIESSDRAYFAAEAGIEDALYELSPHFAGYETPDLPIGSPEETDEARKADFNIDGDITWANRWEVKNLSNAEEFGTDTDENLTLKSNQKLIISLFNDSQDLPSASVANAINTDLVDINHLEFTNFSINFSIPYDLEDDYSDAFAFGLTIDNDGDSAINEDSPENTGYCPGYAYLTYDADCDGRENEDSIYDPVIYWKIIDDEGRSLTPLPGCMTDYVNPGGSEICEMDFKVSFENKLQAGLVLSTEGWNDTLQEIVTIEDFLKTNYDSRLPNTKIQMEFTLMAPLEQATDMGGLRKLNIPHLEYSISSDIEDIPLPYFTIKSDGWYKDFKQSITTYVTPKTAVPLFDFTIIQQQ